VYLADLLYVDQTFKNKKSTLADRQRKANDRKRRKQKLEEKRADTRRDLQVRPLDQEQTLNPKP
ncbi:hypothetical protein SARC_18279, partial [Sphaeroforma arctica JP610]